MPRSPLPPRDGISATALRAPGGKATHAKNHLPVPDTIGQWLRDRIPRGGPRIPTHPADRWRYARRGGAAGGLGRPSHPRRVLLLPPPGSARRADPLRRRHRLRGRGSPRRRQTPLPRKHPERTLCPRVRACTRLRVDLDQPDLVAIHRLDRITAGLLVLSKRPETPAATNACSKIARCTRLTAPWPRHRLRSWNFLLRGDPAWSSPSAPGRFSKPRGRRTHSAASGWSEPLAHRTCLPTTRNPNGQRIVHGRLGEGKRSPSTNSSRSRARPTSCGCT